MCDDGLCVSKCTSADTDCLPNEVCKNGKCTRICSSNDQCGEGRVCVDRLCQAGCITNAECKFNEVCANNQCLDPCKQDNPCGDCAKCETVAHEMQCSCPLGAAGDPFSSCFSNSLRCLPPLNPFQQTCAAGEKCDGGFCIKSCRTEKDCSCGETCSGGKCLQTCLSPRDCNNGLNCVSGLCTGGCLTDLECQTAEACINGQCSDPCKLSECGPNAICQTSGHVPVCLCPKGFQRDIVTGGCRKAQCQSDNDCSTDKKCDVSGLCVNPCSKLGTCGRNAQCSVRNHQAYCLCPNGFVGNPAIQCTRDKDECVPNPCGKNARCTDLIGTYECKCEPGCTGNPTLGCICPPVSPINACDTKRCGANAQCQLGRSGQAQCVCSSTHPNGDPNIGCFAENRGKFLI